MINIVHIKKKRISHTSTISPSFGVGKETLFYFTKIYKKIKIQRPRGATGDGVTGDGRCVAGAE